MNVIDFKQAKEDRNQGISPLMWDLLICMNKGSQGLAAGEQDSPRALRALMIPASDIVDSMPRPRGAF